MRIAYLHGQKTHPRRLMCAKSIHATLVLFSYKGHIDRMKETLHVARKLHRQHFDVIIADTGTVLPVCYLLKHVFKSKSAIIFHLCEPFYSVVSCYEELKQDNLLRRFAYRGLLDAADGYLVNSPLLIADLQKITTKPIEYAPSSLFKPLSTYSVNTPDFAARSFLMIGNYRPEKGYPEMLEAFQQVPQAKRLYILGRSTDKHIPSTDRVIAVGEAEPKNYFRKSLFYVQPSRFDAFSVALMEAMASGLIPVTTRRVGNAFLVEKVHNRLVIDKPDAKALTRVFTWLLKQKPSTLRQLSKKSRAAVRPYTMEKGVARFQRSLFRLIKRLKSA